MKMKLEAELVTREAIDVNWRRKNMWNVEKAIRIKLEILWKSEAPCLSFVFMDVSLGTNGHYTISSSDRFAAEAKKT